MNRTISNLICTALLLTLIAVPQWSWSQKKKKNKGKSELSEQERIVFTEHFFKGQSQKLTGNPEEALDHFTDALKIDPKSDAVLYEMSRINFETGRLEEAHAQIKTASELKPKNTWYLTFLAETYKAKNDLDEALKTYYKIVEIEDRDEYFFEIANLNLFLGKNKEALEAFDEIEKRYGNSEEITREKIELYQRLGRQDDAIDMLNELILKYPSNAFYKGMLAEMYQKSGQNDKAIEGYLKILENDPENGLAHLSLYEHYKLNGADDKASYHIKKAMESNDLGIDMKMNILLTYYTLTESNKSLLAEAKELVDILVRNHPDDAKSYAIQGDFLLRENKLEEARNAFIKAVELAPDNKVIWDQVLALDYELGEFETMSNHAEECLEMFPTNPEFYYYHGLALSRLKDYANAISTLNSGKELVFDNDRLKMDFLSLLGESYNYSSDYKNSDDSFEKALKIDPNNSLILNNYSYYLSLRKEKLEKAEEMIVKALSKSPLNPSYLDTYAWILFQSGQYSKAKEQIEIAIENGGSMSGTVIEHYGDILIKLGDTLGAIEQWEIAKGLGDTSGIIEKKIKEKAYYE